MAGGMGTPVVLCEQLDVLVVFASLDLVLDAVVREVDLAVEVRQVVFARPLANLVLVAVGAAIAVGASAVVFLEELLVLAFRSCSRTTRRISSPSCSSRSRASSWRYVA